MNILAQHVGENDLLLTGQHADDQIETFLLALKRGSGPKGLSAMPECLPFAQGMLIRPLLEIKRSQIEALALSLNLHWIEDESNQDTRYDRNFLRHHVVPSLSERWPAFHQAVQRSASLCAEQESLLEDLLAPYFQSALAPDNSLNIEVLLTQKPTARLRLLRMWLARLGVMMPSQAQLHLIWDEVALAQPDANPKLQLKTGEVRRFQQRLYWVIPHQDLTSWREVIMVNQPLLLPSGLGALTLSSGIKNATIALPTGVDTLQVMFNPEGLSAHPSTRGHSRKLKKLFQEYQVPSWQRRQMPILMHKECVVAVAGLFVDKAFSGQDYALVWDKSYA